MSRRPLDRWGENELKAKLVEVGRERKPSWVWLPLQERSRAGVPDLSVTGNGVSSWWEIKLAKPTFDSTGIQDLTVARLRKQNPRTWYVIFALNPSYAEGVTLLVHPTNLLTWETAFERMTLGFNFAVAAQWIEEAHDYRT